MAIDQNKAVAKQFYERFTANDLPGVMATMTDDATFWILGKTTAGRVAGEFSKPQIEKVFTGMLARLKSGLKMDVQSCIAEGDQVALQVTSYGELKDGRVYDQQYHAWMQIRDGKIAKVREYLDTLHVEQVWFAGVSSDSSADNQRLLEHAFLETAQGRGRAFLDALADDVAWTIIGSTPWSKTYRGKQSVVKDLLQPLNAQFDAANTIIAHQFIAQDDQVVVQARGKNRTLEGKAYENTYCWVFRFAQGKVIELIEYADTDLMNSALNPPV